MAWLLKNQKKVGGGESIEIVEKNKIEYKIKLLNIVNLLEKKILEYFNSKLDIKLTGKEIILNLNNKNIGNLELKLLCEVEFKNVEEINLKHNNISDIPSFKNFKKVKK